MDRKDAPKETRSERREEKRRLHEAHKKARAVEKENDSKVTSADRDKKADKYKDQAQKKTEKGKTDKAQKKVDKASRRRSRGRR